MKERLFMGLLGTVSSFFESTRGTGSAEKFSPVHSDREVIGRYEIITKLGQGASGVVYKAWDQYIRRTVAIKLLHQISERSHRKFFLEAQTAGRLKHQGIVAVHDADVCDDVCYIAMEYVEGHTLEKFCSRDNLLPVNKSLEIILSACNALDYAHREGVIHRDIKPSNIIFGKEGIPKITDFGIAQMAEKTMQSGFFGTPSYMSPEQLKNEVVDSQSDIFSLGCVLYELLTGEKTFSGDTCYSILYKIVNEEPVPVLSIRPDIPEILEKISKKALAKNPKERYQTFIEFSYDMRLALREINGVGKDEKVYGFIEFLRHLQFFHNFTKEQIRELVLVSSIVKINNGKIIISEGEIDDSFYIILSGKARVTKDDKDLALIETGECFGEMAFIAGQTRAANVIADTDCIMLKISATPFDGLSESIQVLFFNNFARTLARRLSDTSKKKD